MPATKTPLAVIGTVAVDAVETPFGKRERVFGGSAAYFSYAASLLTPVALVAVVGEDFPEEYRAILKERPIDLSHLQTLPGKTFSWTGKYEFDMNSAKTLATHLNVLTDFSPQLRFDPTPEFLFLANIDPVLQSKVLDQMQKPRVRYTACDTMNFWIASKRAELLQVFKRIDCVVLNEGEARELTGEANLIRAAQRIREMGPNHVVIKKGEHGVLAYYEGSFFTLPGYPLETVKDPTGAGDTFAGSLMGYLASAGKVDFQTFKTAIAYGSVMASFTVEDFGLDSLRRRKMADLQERLNVFRQMSSF